MAATTSLILLSRLLLARAGARPHLFEIVEGAHLRPEHMNDDVAGIDQHPVAVLLAFDADAFQARLVEALNGAVRDRCDMTVRASAGHDHGVADGGLAGEVDGDG